MDRNETLCPLGGLSGYGVTGPLWNCATLEVTFADEEVADLDKTW